MGTVAVPQWAVPDDQQVMDAHRLAYAHASERGSWRDRGRATALDWAIAGGDAPIGATRYTCPPTHTEVAAMLKLATVASRPSSRLGTDAGEWGIGVTEALTWMLGGVSLPGMDLPRRRPDGAAMTAADLLAERPAPEWWEPEQRAAARRTAEIAALRYAELVELADSVA